jgi:phosphoribosylformimino-5-aminoimidazole carboxamide ribotide isomerase
VLLYPAIDIRGGRVVRLTQGEAARQQVYGYDPAAVARRFVEDGAEWLHVVDLDRAFGEGDNLATIHDIIAAVGSRVRIQLGGGLRSLEVLRAALDLGVTRAVVGTAAALDPEFVPAALAVGGTERVAVGVDARDGRVAVRGWTETSTTTPEDLVRRAVQAGVATVIYTDVSRDGMLLGPDLDGAVALQRAGAQVITSGGVAELEHLRAACTAGLAGAIVGRALYEGRFDLAGALEAARCASSS